jgi:hypothetical protein
MNPKTILSARDFVLAIFVMIRRILVVQVTSYAVNLYRFLICVQCGHFALSMGPQELYHAPCKTNRSELSP